MDIRTDRPFYKDARTHLKRGKGVKKKEEKKPKKLGKKKRDSRQVYIGLEVRKIGWFLKLNVIQQKEKRNPFEISF